MHAAGYEEEPKTEPADAAEPGLEDLAALRANAYGKFQKVGIWAWDHLCLCSFFSRFWRWRMVIFQLSGSYCTVGASAIQGLLGSGMSGAQNGLKKVQASLPSKGCCIVRLKSTRCSTVLDAIHASIPLSYSELLLA